MAKKKSKNNSVSLIRKGIAVLASVLTFIFLFLEFVAVKMKATVLGKEVAESEGLKYFDFLVNSDYEMAREEFGLATAIMWVVFVLVALAVVASVLAFVMKKGSKFSKVGAGLLVVAMVLMFVVNFDKVEALSVETYITNVTALYFVSLALSLASAGAVVTLKD